MSYANHITIREGMTDWACDSYWACCSAGVESGTDELGRPAGSGRPAWLIACSTPGSCPLMAIHSSTHAALPRAFGFACAWHFEANGDHTPMITRGAGAGAEGQGGTGTQLPPRFEALQVRAAAAIL
jgi:hypothetical protein